MAKGQLLVVEDEPNTLMALKDRLEFEGYQVKTAMDGETALEEVHAEAPDCMILDIMLPKIDGFKVCRLLKFDPKYRSVPIIMLTARSQERDKALGKETGADEYLVKPVDMDKVVEKVNEYVVRAEASRAARE